MKPVRSYFGFVVALMRLYLCSSEAVVAAHIPADGHIAENAKTATAGLVQGKKSPRREPRRHCAAE
jgi:hypothetical protein